MPERTAARVHPILRSIVSVLAGILGGFIILAGVEFANAALFPLPASVDLEDTAAVKQALAHAPLASLILVIVGWCLSALLGAWVAARIAHASKVLHGMIVGIFLLGAAITDLLEFPHPLWFWICGLLIFLPASYIGSGLALRKTEQQ
ncbi:MAG TPA: hypothetical protein VKR82_05895 [Candidatus Acidoferrales bacterium]|nr:hypothetical protein [Candidatus Acidoferrales bacterium]